MEDDIIPTLEEESIETKVDPKGIEHGVISGRKSRNMDQGWAWMVLLGGALNHVIADGIVASLGVYIIVWKDQLSGSISALSWTVSLLFGVSYIAGPLGSALCKSFSLRDVTMGGTILSSLAFVVASNSSSLWHLYASFSIAGLGLALTIQPSCVVIAYYFDRLLARANGVSYAGVGAGLFIFPPVFQLLIEEYGWRGALLMTSALLCHNGLCAALFRQTPLEVKSRRDETYSKSRVDIFNKEKRGCCSTILANFAASFDFTLLKDVSFSFLMLGNICYGFSYSIVIMCTPGRAVYAGLSQFQSAMLVSVIGISSFVSRLTHGSIIDYKLMTASTLTLISFFTCAICCMVNPFVDSYEGLMVLSVLEGLTSGVFNSTVPVVAKEYVGLKKMSGAVGLIHLMMGIGFTLGPYKAGILVDFTGNYDFAFFVAGGSFLLCSLFIFVKPASEYLKNRTDIMSHKRSKGLVGQINSAVVSESTNIDLGFDSGEMDC